MNGTQALAILGWVIGIACLIPAMKLWAKPDGDFVNNHAGSWFLCMFAGVCWLFIGICATCALIWPIPN